MKLLGIIRAVEWWDYKFPPILAGAYLVFAVQDISLSSAIPLFFLVVSSLIAGAIYVSLVNDVTDVHDDRLAGKQNRMSAYSRPVRIASVWVTLMLAAGFAWYIHSELFALLLYISCYICFTLYSVPPFRLKKRGLAGIFADAAGSQLLPTLYAAAVVAASLDIHLDTAQVVCIGLWSLCFGLRGILWHQFHDLENDIRSGLHTWVQKLGGKKTRVFGLVIIAVEILSLLVLLISFGQYLCFAALGFYFIYLWLRRKKTAVEVILIRYTHSNYCIFMNEYYQVFMPFAILLSLATGNPNLYVLLILHVVLFPMGFYRVLKNIFSRQLSMKQQSIPYSGNNP